MIDGKRWLVLEGAAAEAADSRAAMEGREVGATAMGPDGGEGTTGEVRDEPFRLGAGLRLLERILESERKWADGAREAMGMGLKRFAD